MSTHSLTDREPPYLHERAVTGDREFRDAAIGRSQKRDKEVDSLAGQLDALIRTMREDAAECGLDDIAERAEEAKDALADWLSDYRLPLASAVEEAGEG